jgi:hypothetical protein
LIAPLKNKRDNQLSEQITVTRTPKDRNKIKSKNIKVSDEVHETIGNFGKTNEEYGDVVERILRHYLACPKVKEEKVKSQQLQ